MDGYSDWHRAIRRRKGQIPRAITEINKLTR